MPRLLADRKVSDAVRRLNPTLFAPPSTPITPAAPSERRLRQSMKPKLNKLETEFLEMILEPQRKHGSVIYEQAMRYEIARGSWYKPDFVVYASTYAEPTSYETIGPQRVITPIYKTAYTQAVAYEVKGPHVFKGAFEVLKSAARLYPVITWKLVWRDKDTGLWKEQLVLP